VLHLGAAAQGTLRRQIVELSTNQALERADVLRAGVLRGSTICSASPTSTNAQSYR
jgi:hypothetical protein